MTELHEFEAQASVIEECFHCPLPRQHPVHVSPALPDLPYAGTSGWSGSETSRERAETADADGTTTERQQAVLRLLRERNVYADTPGNPVWTGGIGGLTWKELGVLAGMHHGQASGALSVLHKEGRIARLTERRNRCAVYVLPEYVQGRETSPHGGKGPRLTPEEEATLARAEEALTRTSPILRADAAVLVRALRRLA
jgi:hypothetical protein